MGRGVLKKELGKKPGEGSWSKRWASKVGLALAGTIEPSHGMARENLNHTNGVPVQIKGNCSGGKLSRGFSRGIQTTKLKRKPREW